MIAQSKLLLLGSAGLVALSACTDPTTGDPNRTATGALIGAATGAAVGAATSSNDLRGAVIGGAIGAAAGGVIGNVLDRQAEELRQDFSNSEIDVINTGSELIVRMPQDILFATDSAQVSSGLVGDLRVLASNLQRYPDSVVEVQGHTDNTGTADYNQDLSQRRAESVTSILVSNGVSSTRLRAIGLGENQPIASNLDPLGRSQNRRVQIIIRPNSV